MSHLSFILQRWGWAVPDRQDQVHAMRDGNDASGAPEDGECSVCRQLVVDGHPATNFVVVPASGGGWPAWATALLRYLRRIGNQPTRAVIFSQPTINARYVQMQIGHGLAHAEASSNVYLPEDSKLSADDERLLRELGWRVPAADVDDPDEYPANWSLPLVHGDWNYLVEMSLATLVGVFGFFVTHGIRIDTFGCDSPCRDCSWPAEFEDDGANCADVGL